MIVGEIFDYQNIPYLVININISSNTIWSIPLDPITQEAQWDGDTVKICKFRINMKTITSDQLDKLL